MNKIIEMFITILILLLASVFTIWGLCALGQVYSVWSMSKEGEAELSKANYSKQIAIREADAKMSSSKYLAEAEIIRAKGVAESNKIIGDSLKNNEGYLNYLYINNLAETKNQIIYIPTEANLPITESTRLTNKVDINKKQEK